jgi:hypothetical protein
MRISATLTESIAICDRLNTTNVNNVSVNTIGVDMSKFKRVLWVVENHGLNAAGTIDGRVQICANSNFNTPVNMTGTNLNQMTANFKVQTVEVRQDQVVAAGAGNKYARLQLTGGGNALNLSAIGLGVHSVYGPANQFQLNTSYLDTPVVCNI